MQAWPAPAKLNLFLHVVGRRADGYHLLQTVFQFLDVADTLRFRVNDDGVVRRLTPLAGVPEAQDLCVRAARLLKTRAGTHQGADIALEKRLPLGGGLGGGSSDAATTLLALNHLWSLQWPLARLASLGLELGADVPVFVHGRAAWAEGVGERLTAVNIPESWYVVLVPPVQIATAAVFREPQLTRSSPPITIRDFLAGRARNDLEATVRGRYPEVDAALTWLARFGPARLTGSGACVFLPVSDAKVAERILERRPRGLGGFVARGLNMHPIHAWLASAPRAGSEQIE